MKIKKQQGPSDVGLGIFKPQASRDFSARVTELSAAPKGGRVEHDPAQGVQEVGRRTKKKVDNKDA